jgi:hypothetical protein
MKTILAIALVSSFAMSAQAATQVTCFSDVVGQPQHVAIFTLGAGTPVASLTLPNGKRYSGTCTSAGRETNVSCNVQMNSDYGYQVLLFSLGGSKLLASATAWSRGGQGRTIPMTCIH